MRDLDRALADIVAIRTQMAKGVVFRGLGPATLAVTGVLALGVAAAQAVVFAPATENPIAFLATWVATAIVAAGLIGAEAITRSKRLHSDLADDLIRAAIEQFLPVAVAGALLALVFVRAAPESVWMLPGLWQILVGIGVFGAARLLPRGLVLAGGWYLLAGIGVIWLAADTKALSPWLMGLPFCIGQLLVAAILQISLGGRDGD